MLHVLWFPPELALMGSTTVLRAARMNDCEDLPAFSALSELGCTIFSFSSPHPNPALVNHHLTSSVELVPTGPPSHFPRLPPKVAP